MVSSGTVTSDASTLSSKLATYTSTISELSSSWKGASYDGVNSKSTSFITEFQGTIEGQMTSFAEALDLYEQYKTAKQNVEISKNNYNQAVSNNDKGKIRAFLNDVNKYREEQNRLKGQIESALSSASSPKLEATAISPKTSVQTAAEAKAGEDASTATTSAVGSNAPFKNYYQYNYSEPYSQGTIKTSGCGPTSLAMVLTNLLGREVSPVETAAKGNGKYTCSSGTKWNYFNDMAKEYGVKCDQMNATTENLVSSLQSGKKVILSMKPGHFTKRGHFIVARGLDANGKVIVSDPASEERSNQTWDVSTIVNEGKQLWAMSA